MPRRKTQLVAGEYYHIYNRGNNRSDIFFENENYSFFLRRLREYLQPQTSKVSKTSEVSRVCTVIAYCLMPNHYHLILQPHDDQLSHHLQMFTISYTKAINKRYERVGALLQGAFQAKRIDREEYLLQLSRYIHLNPVFAGFVNNPEDWEFSSYRDYIGSRNGTLPNPKIVLDYFPSREAYREFLESGISAHDQMAGLLFEDD